MNDISSKSLLANVYDNRINDFVLNDDFGILNIKEGSELAFKYSNAIKSNNNQSYGFRNSNSNNFIRNRSAEGYKISEKDLSVLNKNKNSNALQFSPLNKLIAPSEINMLKKDVHVILKELRSITKRLQDGDDEDDKSLDWKFAAMVLDKLCLYVFGILLISSTCVILFTSPNFFKLR